MALLTWWSPYKIPQHINGVCPLSLPSSDGYDDMYYLIINRADVYSCDMLNIKSHDLDVVKQQCEQHYKDSLVALRDKIDIMLTKG